MKSSWVAPIFIVAAAAVSAQNLPSEMVDIGGRTLHIRCVGKGSPTVILTAGLGDGGESWRAIVPDIAKTTRTCAWDRAGLGLSEGSPEPQDVEHTTADLERLLKAARIQGPYVLVGHSIGSFESLMFAYRDPRSVAAMVLVDPSSPFQGRILAAVSPEFGAFNTSRLKERTTQLRACAAGLRSGILSPPGCGDQASNIPIAARIAQAEAVASMSENMDISSAQLMRARRNLGDIPLIILAAGKRAALPSDLDRERPKIVAAWKRMHDGLASLSTRGVNRQIPDAPHYIHAGRPDVVIEAIREAIAAARRS